MTDETDPPVLLTRADGVATITMNRPRRKNAMTAAGWTGLRDALADVAAGTDRVLVLTGAGTDFCAGADLGGRSTEKPALLNMRVVGEACIAAHRQRIPVIARVDGVAVGAGMNLALSADFVIATTRARFSEIFVKRGLSVDFGGSWILPRLIGLKRARELVMLGEIIGAEEADRLGLLHRLVDPDKLDAAVAELADVLKVGPPVAMDLSKQLLSNSFDTSLERAVEDESRAQAINLAMTDAAEAASAFLEKRTPVFRGR